MYYSASSIWEKHDRRGGQSSFSFVSTDFDLLNKWSHIAIVHDASLESNDPILYIDGVDTSMPRVTAPVGAAADLDRTTITVGANAANSRDFNGTIDEVMIYNRALTANEILQIYNAQK